MTLEQLDARPCVEDDEVMTQDQGMNILTKFRTPVTQALVPGMA